MKNNKELEKNEQVHIEQINPRTELNDLEKTAILQFELENKIHKEEELSKTQLDNSKEFKIYKNCIK